jgi:hypothetical protein
VDGDPFPVRVIPRRADAVTAFGEARLWSETTRFDLRVREVAEPRPGDRIVLGARPSSSRASRCATASGWSGRWTPGRHEAPKLDITPDLVGLMRAEIAAASGGHRGDARRGHRAEAGLARPDRRRRARDPARQHDPVAGLPEATGTSLNAAALVWSKAPVIVGAHDTGPLIRSKSGFWLAIPTPAAGRAPGAGASRPAPGSGAPGCGCASSTAAPGRACSSPRRG